MKEEKKAYIAGFLDGDGCIMMQLVRRKDYVLGYQIRASVVFYQKTKYKDFLIWLKSVFKTGYVRNRNDDITEYTIVGFKAVEKVLKLLLPYIKLKKKQALIALKIIKQTPAKRRKFYTPKMLLKLAKEVDKFRELNYSRKRTNTYLQVEKYLRSKKLLSP